MFLCKRTFVPHFSSAAFVETSQSLLRSVGVYTSGIMSRTDLLLLLLPPIFSSPSLLQLTRFLQIAKSSGGTYRNVSPLSSTLSSLFTEETEPGEARRLLTPAWLCGSGRLAGWLDGVSGSSTVSLFTFLLFIFFLNLPRGSAGCQFLLVT